MKTPIEDRPFTSQCIDAAELLHIAPDIAERIRATPGGSFRPLGQASLVGFDIYVGLKTRGNAARRWAHEAIVADQVMSQFPETIHAFPLFTLPLIAERGGRFTVGLLTEDFTNNGAYPLEEYQQQYSHTVKRTEILSDLEKKVFDAFAGNIYKEAFQHMAGLAGGREVMIDYDDVLFYNPTDVAAYEAVARTLTLNIPE